MNTQNQQLNNSADNSDNITDALTLSLSTQTITQPENNALFDNTPIASYVRQLINKAIDQLASDIHFEPYEKSMRIRFRIDGLLYHIDNLPIQSASQITAILKIMAQCDVTEKRLPQDGRFKIAAYKQQAFDFRLNTCPTIYGEKVVVRLLNASKNILNVDLLGFEKQQQQLFINAIHKPQGMILVTGPTGSGKTVTLYSALSILNRDHINISTVEDPVEINLLGINQVNINQKIGLHFATALRALLRQDPDIIMVGEIRDSETAEIALQAAQTGHLVFSTLHTNNAAETLSRLISMGMAHYQIAASLTLIIAQRLARRLCTHCKTPVNLSNNALKEMGIIESHFPTLNIYSAVGCDKCNNGYKGRIAIYEILSVTPQINQMILDGNHPVAIAQQAQSDGMISLRQSGLKKVCEGITSIQELDRVIKA